MRHEMIDVSRGKGGIWGPVLLTAVSDGKQHQGEQQEREVLHFPPLSHIL